MNPQELKSLIKSRRSIRKYLVKKVPDKIIDELIEVGTWAPSAMNRQPWEFVVITDKKVMKELSERVKELGLRDPALMKVSIYADRFKSKEDRIFYDAPLLILITANRRHSFAKFDTGLAVMNMMLYARALGLGSCWIGFANKLNEAKEILKKLRIPEENELLAALVFGYPDESPSSTREKPVILSRI